jgi:peptide-methionine (S)-S-oxide reductase
MNTRIAFLLGLGLAAGPAIAEDAMTATNPAPAKTEIATFAGGCFWCVEAVLQQVDGVKSVASGYTGGNVKNPSYEAVCSGRTGHAEAVQIEFDPAKVSYSELLDIFWQAIDPTQMNRQGNDVGTQYRSAIFYHGESQKKAAEASKQALEASGKIHGRIVTAIEPAVEFYKAEAYHQNYYRENQDAPYCKFVIVPKLKKLGMK